uniref:Uncharacterized protein n=1 Tax=Timema cristinae TaxID=61476 RepID=A0A7R9HCL2_TIMCR|nr:unnamed protein product [Timema cristinae]
MADLPAENSNSQKYRWIKWSTGVLDAALDSVRHRDALYAGTEQVVLKTPLVAALLCTGGTASLLKHARPTLSQTPAPPETRPFIQNEDTFPISASPHLSSPVSGPSKPIESQLNQISINLKEAGRHLSRSSSPRPLINIPTKLYPYNKALNAQ